METLAILLTVHFVGDFLLQSNWMALGKSKNWKPLTAHVAVYTMTFVLPVALIMATAQGQFVPLRLWQLVALAKFIGLTFVTHWLTDYVTSRWTARLRPYVQIGGIYTDKYRNQIVGPWIQKRDGHWFFVVIGLDQLVHVWTLCLSFKYAVGGF